MITRFSTFLTAGLIVASAADCAELVAYWSFDQFDETGDNPAGTPQGTHEGWFADLSGNGHSAYAANLTSVDYVPMAPGRSGNAFYSKSPTSDAQRGALAVVKHSDLINFDGEDFTISFWEKVAFRDVAGNGWASGRGRTQWFTKAPFMPAGSEGIEGYGLNLTQNRLSFVGNDSDNFGQDLLGDASFTYPSGASAADSNTWAHWAITGSYEAGADAYTITVYLSGEAVDWNGAVGTSFTVANETIDNDGDLTFGGFFRNDTWSHQRFLSWNMTSDPASIDGEGWLDDFAMWAEVLDAASLTALADGSANPLSLSGGAPAFAITAIAHETDGQITMTWRSKPAATYTILYSGDLGNFGADAGDDFVSQGDTTTVTIPNPLQGSARVFFKVRENE